MLLLVDVGRVALRAAEHHVLEEMREARAAGLVLVARARCARSTSRRRARRSASASTITVRPFRSVRVVVGNGMMPSTSLASRVKRQLRIPKLKHARAPRATPPAQTRSAASAHDTRPPSATSNDAITCVPESARATSFDRNEVRVQAAWRSTVSRRYPRASLRASRTFGFSGSQRSKSRCGRDGERDRRRDELRRHDRRRRILRVRG